MVKLKERRRLSDDSVMFKLIKDWQKVSFNDCPTDEDLNLFLCIKKLHNENRYNILKHWNETRQNREYLTAEEIKDWFEFY